MNFQNEIIEILQEQGGESVGSKPYSVHGVQKKISESTDRVVVPAEIPLGTINDLLEDNSGISTLLRKYMDTPGGIVFFTMMSTGDERDTREITIDSLAHKLNFPSNGHYAQIFQSILPEGRVTFGDVHKARKVLEAWHKKKLSEYVAEFWKKVDKEKKAIIDRIVWNIAKTIQCTGNPMFLDPRHQLSMINMGLTNSLYDVNQKLGDFYVSDPQFALWERIDTFLHEGRPGTRGLSGSERLVRNIQTGISAGMIFARGCLSVALSKTGNARQAAKIFLNSANKILSTPGMFGLHFIAAISVMLEDTTCLSAIIEIMKTGRYSEITGEIDTARERHMKNFDVSVVAAQDGDGLTSRLTFESQYAYNPDLFEIHDGFLRVCPWFIDFVRLVVAREEAVSNLRIVETGCPMMHVKTAKPGQQPTVLMQDFALFYGGTALEVWSKLQ